MVSLKDLWDLFKFSRSISINFGNRLVNCPSTNDRPLIVGQLDGGGAPVKCHPYAPSSKEVGMVGMVGIVEEGMGCMVEDMVLGMVLDMVLDSIALEDMVVGMVRMDHSSWSSLLMQMLLQPMQQRMMLVRSISSYQHSYNLVFQGLWVIHFYKKAQPT